VTAAKIAELNDELRKHGAGNGRVMVTRSLRELGSDFELAALLQVRAFDAFTSANDPRGEHDFGSFSRSASHGGLHRSINISADGWPPFGLTSVSRRMLFPHRFAPWHLHRSGCDPSN
jgi:hypothetical protein